VQTPTRAAVARHNTVHPRCSDDYTLQEIGKRFGVSRQQAAPLAIATLNSSLADFRRAVAPDGMQPSDFVSFRAFVKTQRHFIERYTSLEAFIVHTLGESKRQADESMTARLSLEYGLCLHSRDDTHDTTQHLHVTTQ